MFQKQQSQSQITQTSLGLSPLVLQQRTMQQNEVALQEGSIQIEDSKTKLLKWRYAVLSPTRLLLFRGRPQPADSALAVYPILQTEFHKFCAKTPQVNWCI